MDEDVVRSPKILRRANAACMWAALKGQDDDAGLRPGNGSSEWPQARFHATLTSSDSASVNHLLIKHLETVVADNHFVMSAFCLQHRTGSAVEAMTKRLGILGKVMCTAHVWQSGDFAHELKDAVRSVLEEDLVIRPLSERIADARGDLFATEMLGHALKLQGPGVADAAGAESESEPEDEVVAGQDRGGGKVQRAKLREDFLSFFTGSWSGHLLRGRRA